MQVNAELTQTYLKTAHVLDTIELAQEELSIAMSAGELTIEEYEEINNILGKLLGLLTAVLNNSKK